ncbi:hypothetical protein [Halodurantibacterium flavum]|uniref:Uncharacterized protein n=1 Tax=Halodurantibacterium flavum TaxID=1382802 RepID=A0ABW4SAY8_9RHOB
MNDLTPPLVADPTPCLMRFRLVTPAGKLLSGGTITFLQATEVPRPVGQDTEVPALETVTADEEGRGEIPLNPGTYKVRVRDAEGNRFQTFHTVVPQEEEAVLALWQDEEPQPPAVISEIRDAVRQTGEDRGVVAGERQTVEGVLLPQVNQRASAAEMAAGAADASATYADAKAEDAEISAGLAQQRATLAQQWAEGATPGGAGTKSAKGYAEDAAGFAAAVPAQVARVERDWRQRQFFARPSFASGITGWATQFTSRMTIAGFGGIMVLTGQPDVPNANFNQIREVPEVKSIDVDFLRQAIRLRASAAGASFRWQMTFVPRGGGASVSVNGNWTDIGTSYVTHEARFEAAAYQTVDARLQFRNYAGITIEVQSIEMWDDTIRTAMINSGRGYVDMASLREASADSTVNDLEIAPYNNAIINAALAAAVGTGRAVRIAGHIPFHQINLPSGGNFMLEMPDSARLAATRDNTGAFVRMNYSLWGNRVDFPYLDNVRLFGLRLEPFTKEVSGSTVPMTGNGLLGRFRKSELHGINIIYHGSQAMNFALIDSNVYSPWVYTEDTRPGSGGFRWQGGRDSTVHGASGVSGDDFAMLFGFDGGAQNIGYNGVFGQSRRARLLYVGGANYYQGMGDIVRCFAHNTKGSLGGIAVVANHPQSKVLGFMATGIQAKTEYQEYEYGDPAGRWRPNALLTIFGAVEDTSIEMQGDFGVVRSPFIIAKAGTSMQPKKISLDISGHVGDFVPGAFGSSLSNYSDTYGSAGLAHGVEDLRVHYRNFVAGSGRHGFAFAELNRAEIGGSLIMNDAGKSAAYGPDSIDGIETYVLRGIYNPADPNIEGAFIADAVAPQSRSVVFRDFRTQGPCSLSNLGFLSAETTQFAAVSGGSDQHVGWAPRLGLQVNSMPQVGSCIAGTRAVLRSTVATGGLIREGYQRLTTGSGHVFGVDWAAVMLQASTAVLTNIELPIITAPSYERGQTATCDPRVWVGTGAINYAFRWFEIGNPTPVATGQSYTFAATDDYKQFACEVTGTDATGQTEVVMSLPTPPILGKPRALNLPYYSYEVFTDPESGAPLPGPRVGQVITMIKPTWEGVEPYTTDTVRHLRNGSVISGASGVNYTLTSADLGAMIAPRNTRANVYGTTTVDGPAIGPVVAA